MKLIIKNITNGNKQEGEVDNHDSINSLFHDLEREGLILNNWDIVKTTDGRIISKSEPFQNLNLRDGEVLLVDSSSSRNGNEGLDRNPKDQSEQTNISKIPKREPERIVAPTFEQLGIFVLDGSPSMTEEIKVDEEKWEALNKAIKLLFGHIKSNSRRAGNFLFSIVNFSEMASRSMGITRALDVNEDDNYDPTSIGGKYTLIHSGLSEAERIAQDFLQAPNNDGLNRSVVIVLLSDGECFEPSTTRTVANRLKAMPKVSICTTFFSALGQHNSEAESLMRDVASDSNSFKNTHDVSTLRNFFISSLST